jgi:hypothetical protein
MESARLFGGVSGFVEEEGGWRWGRGGVFLGDGQLVVDEGVAEDVC